MATTKEVAQADADFAAMVVLAAGAAQADVFNMGGTRNPTTGTWTGSASLEFFAVGYLRNAGDTTVMGDA